LPHATFAKIIANAGIKLVVFVNGTPVTPGSSLAVGDVSVEFIADNSLVIKTPTFIASVFPAFDDDAQLAYLDQRLARTPAAADAEMHGLIGQTVSQLRTSRPTKTYSQTSSMSFRPRESRIEANR
jgi:hypothetical protein